MIFHHAGSKALLNQIIKRLGDQQDLKDFVSQESIDLNPFSGGDNYLQERMQNRKGKVSKEREDLLKHPSGKQSKAMSTVKAVKEVASIRSDVSQLLVGYNHGPSADVQAPIRMNSNVKVQNSLIVGSARSNRSGKPISKENKSQKTEFTTHSEQQHFSTLCSCTNE